jgi:hypothetical protein
MCSVCIVELRVTVNYIKTLSVEKKDLWQIYLTDNNRTCLGVHVNCPILTDFLESPQYQMPDICPMRSAMIHADRRT